MTTTQNGFLIIADITGYTAFLSGSELEHAEDSLRSLINLLIEKTQIPLIISRLEGDAVISYAHEGSFLQGQTLVEMMESTYVSFKRAIELIVLNTTCTCNACRNIPNLDLKFFVHFGTFMEQKLPTYTELIGTDVNLIHRITKNQINEKAGYTAYVAYTRAAVEALEIQEIVKTMIPHTEEYDHIGSVIMFVQDMGAVWDREQDRSRILVEPKDALVLYEHEYPLPLTMMWDYVTKPEYKALLADANSAKIDQRTNGRIGLGSAYMCAHGENVSPQTIVDWQPFKQYSIRSSRFLGMYSIWTTRIDPTDGGTNVTTLSGNLIGGNRLTRWIGRILLRKIASKHTLKGFEDLKVQIDKEIKKGFVSQPETNEFSNEAIRKAIAESLVG